MDENDTPPLLANFSLQQIEDYALRLAFTDWLRGLLQDAFPDETIPEDITLEEMADMESNMARWRKRMVKKAQVEAIQKVLIEILRKRFGPLPQGVRRQVQATCSKGRLMNLVGRAVTAQDLSELGLS